MVNRTKPKEKSRDNRLDQRARSRHAPITIRSNLDRNKRRFGFSMIEIVVSVLILSILTAVAIPGWSRLVTEMRTTSAVMALQSDIQALIRHAARSNTNHRLTVTAGSSVMTVVPAVPNLIGDTNGVIDYGRRYPGVIFQTVDFDGRNDVELTMYGDMRSMADGSTIDTCVITMETGGESSTMTMDMNATP